MFGHRFFGARYFGPRYWGPSTAAAPAVVRRGVSDTTDPIFYDWWRKQAEQVSRKRKRRDDEAIPAPVVATEPQLQQPRKPRTLSAATLAGIEDAQGLDDIRRLMVGLRGAEAQMLRELVRLYEREREDEEDVELLLIS